MSGENKRKADEEPVDNEAPETKLAKQDEHEHAGVAQLAADAQAVIQEKVTTGAFSPSALDAKAYSTLASLPADDQASALRQFFATNIAAMKNPSAYLAGVVRSIRGSSGRGDAVPRSTNSAVSKQLDYMHKKNILNPGDLDEKLMQRIHSEPEDQVMHALRLYAERVPADCRNHSAFFTSLLNNARSQLSNGGGPGGFGGPHSRMPPRGMMPMHMMMHGMPGQMRPPFRGPPGPPMMRPPFGSPGRGMPSPGKGAYRGGGGGYPRDFTQEQIAEGVRVDELHTCSEYACFVAPYAAKELQNLFDSGVGLVDMMDERAWRQLASLRPEEALEIVSEVGNAMREKEIRNVNAFFTSVVKRNVDNLSERLRNFEDRLAGADGGGAGPPPPHIETRVYDYEAAAPRPPPPAVRPPVGGPVYGYASGGGRGGGAPMLGSGGHQGGSMAAGGGYAMQPPQQPNGGQVMNGAQAQHMQYAQHGQQAMPQHTQQAQMPMTYATSGYGVQQPAPAQQQPQAGQQMQQYAQQPQQQQYAAPAAQPQQPDYQQQPQAAQQQMYHGYGSAVAAGGMQQQQQQQQQGVYSGQMAAPPQAQQPQQQQQQLVGGVPAQQGGYYTQQAGAYAQNVAAGGAPSQQAYGQHAAMPGQAQPGMQYGR